MPALELRSVSAGYGDTVVLENVDLAIEAGGCRSILGRNGVGKSSLLKTVMGHTHLHSGQIILNGIDITGDKPHQRARHGLGFVPQEREVFPSLTVVENLKVAAQPGPWALERVFELFPRLVERAGHRGGNNSNSFRSHLSD